MTIAINDQVSMNPNKPLIIITGASSGIGAGIAKLFSSTGLSLGLFSRNIKALQALDLPHTICIETDVTDSLAFKNAVTTAEDKFGPVDCLINNAGFGKDGDFCALWPNLTVRVTKGHFITNLH